MAMLHGSEHALSFDTKRDDMSSQSFILYSLSYEYSATETIWVCPILDFKDLRRTPSPVGKHGIINKPTAVSLLIPLLPIISSLSRAMLPLAQSTAVN